MITKLSTNNVNDNETISTNNVNDNETIYQ